MSAINPDVLENAEELAERFGTAAPFRHVEILAFLRPDLCESLLRDFPAFESRYALNEMGERGNKAVRMDVRDISPAYRELDEHIQSEAFLNFVSEVTGIPGLLYDPHYIGGGTHENLDGQGLDVHIDFNFHPLTRWHRRLNLIVYLNEAWNSDWGGNLELHPNPWTEPSDGTVSIVPAFNLCAIFETTENSWHGFSRIHLPPDAKRLSRKSFAIYLYTLDRPEELTAPPHSTIYVPDTMPADWQAGRVLGDADVQDLRQRFTRLRTQLRYLYDREKAFGAQISALEGAIAELRSNQRLEIQGYAVQPTGARGLWPDGWVGKELVVSFVATRPASRLKLEVWSPRELGSEQELRITVDDIAFSQILRPGLRTPIDLPLKLVPGQEATLKIHAPRSWTPSDDGHSTDERPLAYRVLQATLS